MKAPYQEPVRAGPREERCQCGKVGSFGLRIRASGPGEWYCVDHLPPPFDDVKARLRPASDDGLLL